MIFGELKKGQQFYTRHTGGVNKYIKIGLFNYDRSNSVNTESGNRARFEEETKVTLITDEGVVNENRVPTAKLIPYGATHWALLPDGLYLFYRVRNASFHVWAAHSRLWIRPDIAPYTLNVFE